MSATREVLGLIGIDTARLAIGDPCYIDEAIERHERGEDCEQTSGGDRVFFTQRDDDMLQAAIVPTGYGDGCYPVTIERNADGRIAKLVVEFIPET